MSGFHYPSEPFSFWVQTDPTTATGQVIESRHPDFKPGDIVRGDFSWHDYVVTDRKGFGGMQKVAPGTPPNLALSLFGVDGLTAYFGMIEIGKIRLVRPSWAGAR